MEPIRQKVAILGTAPSVVAAPFADPTFEIWSCNGAWGEERSDRHFQMHTPEPEHIESLYGDPYMRWLSVFPGPVYMQRPVPWVPKSVALPIEVLSKEFPEHWGCTPAYMIALAIHEGFREIAICGIELIHDSEYKSQREAVQFYLGLAIGRGIKVSFPGGSALEKHSTRYGYDHPPEIPDALTAENKRQGTLAEKRWNECSIVMQRAEGGRQAFQAAAQMAQKNGYLDFAQALQEYAEQAEKARSGALAERFKAEGVRQATGRMECTIAHVATGA